MITTLTGDNGHMLQRHLRQAVDNFVAEYTDMGLERLDGEDVSFDRLRESLQSLPFLVNKKLVVLRTPGANKQFVDQAAVLLADVAENIDVIIVEPRLDKRLGYYKFLKSKTNYQQFDTLDDAGLARYLVTTAQEQGGKLSTADARYLVGRTAGSTQISLGNELTKLIHYDPHITRTAIDLLVEPALQSTIFELLDAALAGKVHKAMELYDLQRAARVEPQQIMAMIAWQLHVLALVKAAGGQSPDAIAKAAKLSPYVVRKSTVAAQRLSITAVWRLVSRALSLDVRMKSAAINPDEAVRLYLLELSIARI